MALNNALSHTSQRHKGAAWADLDSDGGLDLFISTANSGSGFAGHTNDFLFRNTAIDFVSRAADVAGDVAAGAADSELPAWCDFDNDGDADLYVANGNGTAFPYQNDGTGRLQNIQMGSVPSGAAFECGTWAGIDNHGFFDLLPFGDSATGPFQRLHFNRGGKTFEDVTEVAGLGAGRVGWGPAFGDYDNDGDLDLFVACGETGPYLNLLYRLFSGGTEFLAHFGLGVATQADVVRIEWRSGAVLPGRLWRRTRMLRRECPGDLEERP